MSLRIKEGVLKTSVLVVVLTTVVLPAVLSTASARSTDLPEATLLTEAPPLGAQIAGVLGSEGSSPGTLAGYFSGDVHISDVLCLPPTDTFPDTPQDGYLCVKGSPGFCLIYRYLNGAWRQLHWRSAGQIACPRLTKL